MDQVIQQDCLEWMRTQPDNCLDVVVSSPPYNININYNTYADKRENYTQWMRDVWEEAFRLLKPTGHLFLNIQPTRDNPFMPYEVVSQLSWKVQNTFIWNKCVEIDGYVRGQGTPASSNRFLPNGWEFVFHLTEQGKTQISQERSGVPYQPQWAEDNFKRSGRTWRPSVNSWFVPYETVGHGKISSVKMKGEKKHPAIYPRELVRKCLRVADVQPNQVIYDPFGGTGTTATVAKEFDCQYITTEIDPDYVEFIKERLR